MRWNVLLMIELTKNAEIFCIYTYIYICYLGSRSLTDVSHACPFRFLKHKRSKVHRSEKRPELPARTYRYFELISKELVSCRRGKWNVCLACRYMYNYMLRNPALWPFVRLYPIIFGSSPVISQDGVSIEDSERYKVPSSFKWPLLVSLPQSSNDGITRTN